MSSRPAHAFASLALLTTLTAAQGSATYEVTFDATWSASTHPGAYPSGAHFSPLIGATHGAATKLWEAGGVSTSGFEIMAETGGTSLLTTEINGLIGSSLAGQVITGAGIGSPASTTSTFTATTEFPLVSLVTMIAPSPDWFVGTESLDLLAGGAWVDHVTVDLFAYDAGTDGGASFTSPNQDTTPHAPIQMITGGPFFGTTPLGTYTFTRQSSTLVYGCGVNPAGSMDVVAGSPTLGQTVTLALADPTGAFALPAATFLAVSATADPAFPCGTPLAGLGLGAPGAIGELLIGTPAVVLPGPAFGGAPAPIDLTIPNQVPLVGQTLFGQGLLADPTGRLGLTDGVELYVGN